MKKILFSVLIVALGAVVFVSCGPPPPPENKPTAIELSKTSIEIEVDATYNLAVKFIPTGTTGDIVWSVDDSSIATVQNGIVRGVKVGTTTVVATCDNLTATCEVNVKAKSVIETDRLLSGSNYYVIVLNDGAFGRIDTKVVEDLRINGAYNDDGSIPAATTSLLELWDRTFIGGEEPMGLDPFGNAEGWITLKTNNEPTDWGLGAGGMRIVHRSLDLSAVTSDYVLVVIYKADASAAADFVKFSVYSTNASGSEWPGNTNVLNTTVWPGNTNGTWKCLEIPMSRIFAAGVDWSQIFEDGVTMGSDGKPKAFYSLGLVLMGIGNQLDLGAAFVYLPKAE